MLKALGADTLLLTNAAGSLRPEAGPGSLVCIGDHINMLGFNPLIGPNDDAIGPRFPSLRDAYDPELRERLHAAARALGIDLHDGVYLAVAGPSFETPAEIRAYRTLGADLVGMSTIPEVIAARHAGLRVAAISAVTNLAEGMGGEELSHEQTLRVAAEGAPPPRPARRALRGGPAVSFIPQELIRRKRDGGTLADDELAFIVDGIKTGELSDGQVAAFAMAVFFRDLDPDERVALTRAMTHSGTVLELGRRPGARQALDRRRRRQGLADAGADRRGLRREGADDLRPRPRPHRRHARQARRDPRLRHDARPGPAARRRRRGRLRDHRPDAGARARRPPLLRAARRDRHGRVDPADRRLDPVQEARRRARRARDGRQGRLGRLPARARAQRRAGARDRRRRARRRAGLRGAA